MGQTLIDISGDDARAESYVTARHLLPGAAEEMVFSGRYLDRLVKRGDRWKIMHRQVVMDWCKRRAISDERNGEAFAALAKGAHRNDDPLYAFLTSE